MDHWIEPGLDIKKDVVQILTNFCAFYEYIHIHLLSFRFQSRLPSRNVRMFPDRCATRFLSRSAEMSLDNRQSRSQRRSVSKFPSKFPSRNVTMFPKRNANRSQRRSAVMFRGKSVLRSQRRFLSKRESRSAMIFLDRLQSRFLSRNVITSPKKNVNR